MKVRTIEQIYDEIKKNDPDTALTRWGLRRMVTTGQIPSVKSGKKYLISMEALQAYLQGEQVESSNLSLGYGEIRPVDIRG